VLKSLPGGTRRFSVTAFTRYYRPYPRPAPNQQYAHWASRVITRGPRVKPASGRLSSEFLPEELRLPDRWPPVPPEIDFPHPNVLDRLTPSTIGVAVTSIAFPGMVKIRIAGRHFWVDLDFPIREILYEIFAISEKRFRVSGRVQEKVCRGTSTNGGGKLRRKLDNS
jgi:hypothetical protein